MEKNLTVPRVCVIVIEEDKVLLTRSKYGEDEFWLTPGGGVEFQETMSAAMGAGVTNKNAEVADVAKQFGVTTPDKFDQLTYPDFGFIWENRSDWSDRWSQIFSQ